MCLPDDSRANRCTDSLRDRFLRPDKEAGAAMLPGYSLERAPFPQPPLRGAKHTHA